MTSAFARLGVPTNLADVLAGRGIDTPTPIQAATLPDSLAGRDVLGRGRTGSGKTYAFSLPLVARLAADRRRPAPGRPRALVLAPTRELASQIADSLRPLAAADRLSLLTIFGGVNQNPQVRALRGGIDILVATPGRLLDLRDQGHLSLGDVEVTVIDEADHMSDMGFLPGVKKILADTPSRSQRLLFSATLDNAVNVLVKQFLHDPVVHEADSAQSPVATMDHHVLTVTPDERLDVIADLAAAPGRTILFTRTKHGAKKLAKQLIGRGIPAVDLHGNLAQNARTRNLEAFGSGRVETLVATDIAARGIHVDDVALVVHADPPTEHKAYLHRSGRTARAGSSGTVITLATPDQRRDVQGLMRAARIKPEVTAATTEVLQGLAPGARHVLSAEQVAERLPVTPVQQQSSGGGGGRSRRGRGGSAGSGSGSRGSGSAGRPASGGKQAPKSSGPRGGAKKTAGVVPAGSSRGVAAFSASAGRSSRRSR
ncbi:DEAD/DEAH box helicase [Propioniciclava coleopterorum]|uniref:DEAD/DEAH box helicase n=1 Tax=Propioniciclava coleopterorum TaxID=2714937 RepID=A0A6G7Y7J9_9ACTN|nr:DEAD/DEAH box helicase [Propioniciclava coleopterorum]QIK72689.1 DEAD/DEAH box helicase [Propioniciclava coleopterorum]